MRDLTLDRSRTGAAEGLPAPAARSARRCSVSSREAGSVPIGRHHRRIPLGDDDLHLALYLAYELHYRGLPGVPDDLEWDPSILAVRRRLEAMFEVCLRRTIGRLEVEPGEVARSSARSLAARRRTHSPRSWSERPPSTRLANS